MYAISLSLCRREHSYFQVLLRWLVLTFDLIDDPAPLHSLYTAVFYYLQVDDLVSQGIPLFSKYTCNYVPSVSQRPTVCQLLCFLTRREDGT